MKVIVLVKQIFQVGTQLDLDERKGSSSSSAIGEDDKIALEEAVRIKEIHGGFVTALSMGPITSRETLRQVYAMGIDEAVLLSDERFEGSDAHATVTVLEAAITKILDYDLILCGAHSYDPSAFEVGPRLAEVCNLPLITYTTEIALDGKKVVAQRDLETERQTVEAKLPCLITVMKDIAKPRPPTTQKNAVISANRIKVWNAADLSLTEDEVGFSGSLVDILRRTVREPRRPITLQGSVLDIAPKVVDVLMREGALKVT